MEFKQGKTQCYFISDDGYHISMCYAGDQITYVAWPPGDAPCLQDIGNFQAKRGDVVDMRRAFEKAKDACEKHYLEHGEGKAHIDPDKEKAALVVMANQGFVRG